VKPPVLRLLCDSNPMCFGSTSAMLSVLDFVPAESTALVNGVTAELLARDSVVDRTISVNNKSPESMQRAVDFEDFDAVLVVSNQSNIALYADVGLPIFFVDVLYWYGPHKQQPVWSLAERTFIQNFPGVFDRLESQVYQEPPVIVGPLIRQAAVSSPGRKGTLIQIGGARSRWIRPGDNSLFSEQVLSWICHQELNLPQPLTLACGKDAGKAAQHSHLADSIHIDSFAYDDFISKLQQTAVYITTPGQGAVFEGLAAGVDLLFLPPQNATQVLQLAIYERAGLVAEGLNLTALDPLFDHSALEASEEQLTMEVLRSLNRINTPEVAEQVARHLRFQYETLNQVHAVRRAFIEFIGSPGGSLVAEAIHRWWCEQWM